jgi:methionine sulfoxide reductase heme-binding subunit
MTAISSYSKPKARVAMDKTLKTIGLIVLVATIFLAVIGILWLGQSAVQPISNVVGSLFALNSVQAWWYVTRAAGLTSYILLWLSMVWGMAIATKILSPAVEGSYSYDFHEFISLLGLGFVALHVVVLLLDRYLPFSVWQVFIPFIDSYRPLWVGLGIIGFYIFLLVTLTFYMRGSIGSQAFRTIHTLSLLGYLGATLHGLFAGTDSALPVTKLIYAGTFLVVVFLTAYWLVLKALNKPKAKAPVAKTPVTTAGRSTVATSSHTLPRKRRNAR